MTPPARRRRRATHGGHSSHERWLVSYADFITLLFAFFTTMYAISTVDAQKMSKMVTSMQTAFASSGRPFVENPEPAATDDVYTGGVLSEGLEEHLADVLRAELGGELVDVTTDRRGVVVSIREAGSFPTGSADLSSVARVVLERVASTMATARHAIRVEGHTDDVPIRSGRFSSNWELSTARATAVVDFLIQSGLSPDRLSAAGYGEYRAREPNDSDSNRARNRRVDIVILNDETVRTEEPQRRLSGGASAHRHL
jgi:chemotaxis protein MotB